MKSISNSGRRGKRKSYISDNWLKLAQYIVKNPGKYSFNQEMNGNIISDVTWLAGAS